MTKKYLITTSIFSLILVSAVQAADVILPEQPAPVVSAPAFSWTGFYLGGLVGGLSSSTALSYLEDGDTGKWIPVGKELLPKLSGFTGGIYASSNLDIDSGFVIGIDTDIILSGQKDAKDIKPLQGSKMKLRRDSLEGTSWGIESRDSLGTSSDIVHHTLNQKWFGATRLRVGFAVDRMMPYIAGGVAYTQLQNIFTKAADRTSKKAVSVSDLLHDEKKTMIGYTLGGGVDFAMTDNVIVRAEYRYSDYGKKKFAQEKIEMGYKTDDFRVGVAYKF